MSVLLDPVESPMTSLVRWVDRGVPEDCFEYSLDVETHGKGSFGKGSYDLLDLQLLKRYPILLASDDAYEGNGVLSM